MIEDFRQVAAEVDKIDAEICIIGCGPVGVALAEELEATGRRVVVVEGGGLQVDPLLQALNKGSVAGLPHTGHFDGRARAVGGTGHLWAGQCLRLDPVDFTERDWVPHSGWPFDEAELAPYYARAERFFRVDARSYGEQSYRDVGIEPPRWADDMLVSHFTLYTPEINTAEHHLGRLRKSSNLRVLTHAHVTQIVVDETGDAVAGVDVRTLDGRIARVCAPQVVLCAGGIENARLLLASRDRQPRGLGNQRDLVGRFFQEHPNTTTAILSGGDARGLQERFRMLYRGGRRFFPKFALSPVQQRRRHTLNCNAHLVFDFPEESGLNALRNIVHAVRRRRLPERPLAQLAAVVRDAGDVGSAAVRRLRGGSPIAQPSQIRLQCYLEQAPNPASRIGLSDTSDRLGMPGLSVDWQVTKLENHTLRVMTQTVAAEFTRLGLGTLTPDPWLEDEGWQLSLKDCSHHIGTTRMAEHAGEGVVDPHGQVFGLQGLHVAGSSVFPTSGYANPTLTAVALAMRLSDRLQQPAGALRREVAD